MQKFDFSILTRDGQRIGSVVIAARNQEEGERKLRQMYRHCEVASCNAKLVERKQHLMRSLELAAAK